MKISIKTNCFVYIYFTYLITNVLYWKYELKKKQNCMCCSQSK